MWSYFLRFTEENFATLIALIFIKKAFEKVLHISDTYPIHESECLCIPKNVTEEGIYGRATEFRAFNVSKAHMFPCEVLSSAILLLG